MLAVRGIDNLTSNEAADVSINNRSKAAAGARSIVTRPVTLPHRDATTS